AAGNDLVGTSGPDGFFQGPVYTIDKTPPVVTSITRTDPVEQRTNANVVKFQLKFSEPVSGVDLPHLALTMTGNLVLDPSNPIFISGTADTYEVTVQTTSGSGTIRVDVVDIDNNIIDLATNPLGGPGFGNGDYRNGEVYIIDRTPPRVGS